MSPWSTKRLRGRVVDIVIVGIFDGIYFPAVLLPNWKNCSISLECGLDPRHVAFTFVRQRSSAKRKPSNDERFRRRSGRSRTCKRPDQRRYFTPATFMLRAMPLARNDWIWVTT